VAGIVLGLPQPAGAATPAVRIVKVQYDSPGPDTRTNASLNAEWVALRNTTARTVTVTGWTLRDAQNHVYALGTLTLGARATVYVHTGKGTRTAAHRYWGSGNYVWNNTGDKAILRDAAGRTLQTCSWGRGAGSVSC
jgi:hypothetical protein